jgi:hypothetical protein
MEGMLRGKNNFRENGKSQTKNRDRKLLIFIKELADYWEEFWKIKKRERC